MPPSSLLLSSRAVSSVESHRRPTLMATGLARRVSSQVLLEGGRELVIQHQGNEYHLRLTRNDKLILTK